MFSKKIAYLFFISIVCAGLMVSCAQPTSSDSSSSTSTAPVTSGLTLSDIAGTWTSTASSSETTTAKGLYSYTDAISEKISADGTYVYINKSTQKNSTYGTWTYYYCYKAKLSITDSILTKTYTGNYFKETETFNEATIPWVSQNYTYEYPIAVVNGKLFTYSYTRQGSGSGIVGTWTQQTTYTSSAGTKTYSQTIVTITDTTFTSKYWSNTTNTFTGTPTSTTVYTYSVANNVFTFTTTTGTPATYYTTFAISGNVLVWGSGATKAS